MTNKVISELIRGRSTKKPRIDIDLNNFRKKFYS